MSNKLPTSFALRFLRSFCPPQLLEEIEGDLLQKYERDLRPSRATTLSGGTTERRAKRRLLWNATQLSPEGVTSTTQGEALCL